MAKKSIWSHDLAEEENLSRTLIDQLWNCPTKIVQKSVIQKRRDENKDEGCYREKEDGQFKRVVGLFFALKTEDFLNYLHCNLQFIVFCCNSLILI